MNKLVTMTHISLISLYTLFNFLVDNFSGTIKTVSFYRLNTAYYFVSGLLDIFVAYVMWFVLDEENEAPQVVRDDARSVSYPVLDIIRTSIDVDDDLLDED